MRSKLRETPKVPVKKHLVPDRMLPGISPPIAKEKRKKKVPEITVSEQARCAGPGSSAS